VATNKDFRVKNGLVVEEGAVISGLTYPTLDGSVDQVIATDGSGNLTLQPAKATGTNVSYDNTVSGLIASNVQSAIDELQDNKADINLLSSNITLFPTTASSDITNYNVMVTSTTDGDYDTTAVNVPTGAISTADQLIASLATGIEILEGAIEGINITTVGNIRKTAGGNNRGASFYFEIYRRETSGTEHLIGTSNETVPIYVTDGYQQFFTSALVYDAGAIFARTDRIVIKYYGTNHGGGSPQFDFLFGGATPVKTLIPVPVEVVVHNNNAIDILTDTTNFNNILSSSDDTIQEAFDTIDNMSIGDISDVDLSTPPTSGQALIWDSGLSKFVPGDSFSQSDFDTAFGLKSINALSDVDTNTTAPTTGQALVWDGTNFVPGDVAVDTTFIGLTDSPSSYTGQAGRVVKVNSSADGVDFGDIVIGSTTREYFTGNGSTTDYILTNDYAGENGFLVFVDGVVQKVGEDYTYSGTTLEFTSAPVNNAEIFIYGTSPIAQNVPGDGTVTANKLAVTAYTRDTFDGDASTTAFTLTRNPGSVYSPFVFVDGVIQDPITHYGISGTTITFTFAPATGTDNILVVYGPTLTAGTVSDGAITFAKLDPTNFMYQVETGDGTTTDFALDQQAINEQHLIVTVASVPQSPDGTTYTLINNGNTISFAAAPANGAKIIIRWYGVATYTVPVDNSVSTSKLQNLSVTTAKIADGSITAAKIANGTIVAAEIADGTITPVKLDREYATKGTSIALSIALG
jgi:hypothetical protein